VRQRGWKWKELSRSVEALGAFSSAELKTRNLRLEQAERNAFGEEVQRLLGESGGDLPLVAAHFVADIGEEEEEEEGVVMRRGGAFRTITPKRCLAWVDAFRNFCGVRCFGSAQVCARLRWCACWRRSGVACRRISVRSTFPRLICAFGGLARFLDAAGDQSGSS
jgi:hypothetical protein